jgi:hypothetical protein
VPAPDDAEFNSIIEFQKRQSMNHQEHIDNSPYGVPQKPGLTKRGKAALGIGAAVIAGGSLIGYQSYAASAAENEAKAQEIALKQQQLELEKLKEMNRANAVGQKAQVSETKTRQAAINTCIKNASDQTGKEYGSASYRDVIDACQAQYAGSTAADDMQAAASSSTASPSTGGGGGVNDGLLIGGGVLVLFLVAAAKKGARSNPA